MPPNKRPRLEMSDEASYMSALQSELQVLKSEVEPISIKRSHATKNEPVKYKPTYRAVLARKGFLVRKTLGSGSYSKVKLAYSFSRERERVAVKIVDRLKAPKDFEMRFLPRELEIWPKMRHKNIIAMQDMFDDGQRVYMILEYAENGDVLRYIQKSGALNESLAKCWISQVCSAVGYMHDQNITHRDLKLENLLLDKTYSIKICDFGFVKGDCTREMSRTYCGSKSYAAPEILKGQPYEPKKSDMWAIGVILYIFITGKMPFDESRGNAGVLDEQQKMDFPWHKYHKVTEDSKALVLWLFQFDYRNRPDIAAVISCSWIRSACRVDNLENLAIDSERAGIRRSDRKDDKRKDSCASTPRMIDNLPLRAN
ncbi:testis-specific serine/threonine-protein kinase 2-like [Gigantopelta aegis]|uniref:testis-specific serine/threonine-protein kinase 2-like n=1 Tax=Gigantopelta aegis TaxID=1735272 RepID=UPI001B88BF4C|nr:testis-specific serine/threonine-protein kinase 2-like [Gigantopelta aegis]